MKRIFMVGFAICSLLFSSCFHVDVPRNIDMENADNHTRMEQIVAALKEKDKDAIIAQFSEKALAEANDWDEMLPQFFDFVEGEILSWEKTGFSEGRNVDHGKKRVESRPCYKLTTDVDEYDFVLIDYTMDTITPENKGLYMIQVSKSSYRELEGYDIVAGIVIADENYPRKHSAEWNKRKELETRMKQFVRAYQTEDVELLASMFPQKVVQNTENFDKKAEEVFDFIQGGITSYQMINFTPVGEYEFDDITYSWWRIETKQKKYSIYFLLNTEGLYSIEISEMINGKMGRWKEKIIAGISIIE